MPTNRKGRIGKPGGKLIEFPRRLEWNKLEVYIGRVKGTMLYARVESDPQDGGRCKWKAFLGEALVDAGEADTPDEGMEAARAALEGGVVVVRPLERDNNPGGSTDNERG
jgi:hypothetical protein